MALNPPDVVGETPIRVIDHAGHEEQIDDLADQQQSAGEQPDHPGDDPSVLEAVNPAEADEAAQPEQVRGAGGLHVVMLRGAFGGLRRSGVLPRQA